MEMREGVAGFACMLVLYGVFAIDATELVGGQGDGDRSRRTQCKERFSFTLIQAHPAKRTVSSLFSPSRKLHIFCELPLSLLQ